MKQNSSVSVHSGQGGLSRRRLLKTTATAAAGATLLSAAPAHAAGQVFRHGVASGDPLPTGVIIWTRVTPSDAATPGSGAGEPVSVHWEVATDAAFTSVVASGAVTTGPDADHTVKVDVPGLSAGSDYFYRFTALAAVSAIGRTRTAPAAQDSPDRLRFGVASCANWEGGYFGAYRHLAAREDLDAVIHLGDYLYEYSRGKHRGLLPLVREHDPVNEIVSLADYRIRHGQYKTDPDLAALHARYPFIAIWDDHESANDAWAGGAENHDPAEGDWQARRAAAMQAYLEWMPVRANGSGANARLYRRFRFGALAELSMLDLRTYRDEQLPAVAGWRETADPNRSITGKDQMDWLTAGLASAPTRWKLVGTPVMFAPLQLPTTNPAVAAAFQAVLGTPDSGIPINLDQWDGYAADRQRLFDTITGHDVADVVFLTGDIHTSWAADVPVDTREYPRGRVAATEFVVPSVSMASIGEIMHTPARTVSLGLEQTVRNLNPHLHYAELDSHGYGVFEVTAEQAQMDWFYVTAAADPNTGVRHGASFGVRSGIGRVEARPGPVN
ncbi:alkaline phosphatase D family protein [Nocardia sp. NPDC127526]|uniref:alkaline phosphatase D family protein n=1 Tax=Nocardia sp. NPDC127526 TaxID=3345393 RepID=UPI003629D827